MFSLLLTLATTLPQEYEGYEGTVTLLDGRERRVPRAGWIEFEIDNMHPIERVEIKGGRWELDISWFEIMGICRIEIEGQPAYCLRAEGPWPHGTYELEARFAPQTTLVAIDAETGQRLSNATLHGDGFGEHLFPSNKPWIWRARGSTLDMLAGGDPCLPWDIGAKWSLEANAPGYLSRRVDIDLSLGGHRDVAFERLGSLIVYADPGGGDEVRDIRLTRAGSPDSRLSSGFHPAIFNDLPPGEYDVASSVADRLIHRKRLRIGLGVHEVVQLDAATKEVSGKRDDRKLTGALTVPPAWDVEEIRITLLRFVGGDRGFELVAELAANDDGASTWTWGGGMQPEGTYFVLVNELPWAFLCELEGDDTHDERTVPEPAKVAVRCVVSRQFDEIRVDAVSWMPLSPTSYETELHPKTVKADAEGQIRFLAPVGEIMVTVAHEGFETTTRRVTIQPGENAVVIPLRRSSGK